MKKLLDLSNKYIKQECSWKDFSLLKICLFSFGLLVGASVPTRRKKPTMMVAASAFAATYVPQMIKFLSFISRAEGEDVDE